MIPPVKGLLFDFGGTLDTNGTHWGIVLQEAYRKAGFVIDEKSFREMYVQGERQLAAQPVIAPKDTFDLVLQKKLALERNYGVEHGLLPDTSKTDRRLALIAEMCYTLALQNTARIHPLLTKLKEKYAIALVSNFYGNLPAVLDDFGLNDCFETVVESARRGAQTRPGHFRTGPESPASPRRSVCRRGRQLQKRHRPRPCPGHKHHLAQRPRLGTRR